MWTGGFYKYENLHTYRRRKVKNILEKKLFNWFGHSLHIYLKYIEHGIKDYADNTCGVCIFQKFLNFLVDSINSRKFNRFKKTFPLYHSNN